MKKLTNMVLMLCLILSGAFCYANSTVGKGNEKVFHLDKYSYLFGT